jgi:Leucine-rich repeat (LRR) protein
MIDLSCNWFGTDALFDVRSELLKFKSLRHLKIGNNKLCAGDTQMASKLREILINLNYLEELDIQENSINDLKFEIIIPAL